ncbi:hypothetical protein GGS21DRAFT_38267 [Xylaria nigripes]|nr:hypothetical protein GGS21DRAFT_38267 [Xylaria nigripes]
MGWIDCGRSVLYFVSLPVGCRATQTRYILRTSGDRNTSSLYPTYNICRACTSVVPADLRVGEGLWSKWTIRFGNPI